MISYSLRDWLKETVILKTESSVSGNCCSCSFLIETAFSYKVHYVETTQRVHNMVGVGKQNPLKMWQLSGAVEGTMGIETPDWQPPDRLLISLPRLCCMSLFSLTPRSMMMDLHITGLLYIHDPI